MRFVFVDRIVTLEIGRAIETVKNVSATEDVFADHFPGHPIFPGALIVEAFEQASQLLIAESHAFARLGRLRHLRRAAFRRFVRPGDQLRIRCERCDGEETSWAIRATARVEGRTVATAVLDVALEDLASSDDGPARVARLRDMLGTLRDELFERPGAAGSA